MDFFETIGQNPLYLLWIWLILINLALFITMGIDKYKAVHGAWRIPEKTLLIMAIIGGSLGGIFGMYAFRHKTRHAKFSVGYPVILILQIAAGIFIGINIK